MSLNVEFLFDFASPNAFLANRVLPKITRRTGATFTYVPVLLGGIFKATGNQSPVVAFANIKNKPDYEFLEMRRFIKRHEVHDFQMNPFFPINTLTIMRGAVAAEMDGRLDDYVAAVMRHMWVEPKKMDDPEIIRAALDGSGFDGARLLARAQEHDVKKRLMDNTERAVARGAFGIPTFFVKDEIYFGKDRLRDVEEEIVRVQAA